jgi:hypothetical protein
MWRRRFGGAGDVVGRVVRINDVPVEIVGVAPPRFVGTGDGEAMTVWLPLAAYPLLQKRTAGAFLSADSMFLTAMARLRPGVTAGTAAPVVAGIATRVFRPGNIGFPESEERPGAAAPKESGSADVVPMRAGNARIGNRRRHGLLGQHMNAGRHGAQGEITVHLVRQRDVHRVHRAAGEQVVVVVVAARDHAAEAPAEYASLPCPSRYQCGQFRLAPRVIEGRKHGPLGDVAHAHDRKPDRCGHGAA